ncbi:MAG TPA: hypothetical protein VHR88_04430 [Solirubrobacteraceae bacterium]|nr:hypothetical protein [Solirubrobacteraceae bacterium]
MRPVVVGFFVACCAVLGLSGQASAQKAPTQAGSVLPVRALVDADTPIQGGSVRVLGPDGHALAQVDGTHERTEDGGVALLAFASLPPRFTVVVEGGRADGHPFHGTLRSMVERYDKADPGVVVVSPLSTIDAAHGVSLHQTKALLGVPSWFDDTDFIDSDRYFDGDRFLAVAQRTGGVDKLIARLVAKERKTKHARLRFLSSPRPSPTATSAAEDEGWQALAEKALKADYKPLISKVLTTVGEGTSSEAQVGTALLGWTLRLVGLGELVEAPANEETNAALKALSESVTQLQSQVADVQRAVQQSRFDVLVGQTQPTLSKIDHAQKQLALLAGLKPDDRTAPGFRDKIVQYIGANLLDKGAELNRALASNVPLADNLLKAASAVEVARRFFDSQSSKAVKSVAGYYALYEAELAILIAEYQHANPDAYSDEITQKTVNDLSGMINGQAASLKPPVASGAVVDTKTNKMWTQHFTPNPVDASIFFRLVNEGGRYCKKVYSEEAFGPRQIEGLPFDDWVLPGKDDFTNLISGRGAVGGVTYLQREARMSPDQNFTEVGRGMAFMAYPDSWVVEKTSLTGNAEAIRIRRFRLGDGFVEAGGSFQITDRYSDCAEAERQKLAPVKGVAVYVRDLAPDESYFWR